MFETLFIFAVARWFRRCSVGAARRARQRRCPRSARLTSGAAPPGMDADDVLESMGLGAADQAEADMRVARAKAEERRAMAVASEQEGKAKTVENRAEVVLSEAEVPQAQADAFRRGSLRASS